MAEAAKNDTRNITESQEFKDAVAAAASKAAADAIEQMVKHGAPLGAGSNDEASSLFRKMALAIAEMANQGNNRKPVDPAIMAARAEAHERCVNLIMNARDKVTKARSEGDKATEAKWLPEYRVVAKIYFNERFIEPFKRLPDKTVASNEIVWTGMPNDALRPINDIARKIYTEFKASIGSTEKLASADNRPVWITAQGLIVKGEPPRRREGYSESLPSFSEEVEVKHDNNDPSAPYVHVLGTIASPAKQNFAEQHKRS